MPSGVYQIRNTKTQKRYIGSGVNVDDRWRKHVRDLQAGRHFNKPLQNAWNKYGNTVFVFELLEPVSDAQQLIQREQWYLDTLPCKELYNIRKVAENNLGLRHTKQTKQHISAKARGRKHTNEAKEKNRQAHLGKKATQNTRQKMSKTRLGRLQSKEHARKRGQATGETLRLKSKLTWPIIRTIRALWASGNWSQAAIGRLYGVCQQFVSHVVRNETWREA